MKKIIIILIIGLNVTSCKFSQKPSDKKKDVYSVTNELLKRDNYVLPDSLFSFFPDKSGKYTSLKIGKIYENAEKSEIPLLLSEFDPVLLIELYQCESKDLLEQLQKTYCLQSLFLVKSENDNYFMIDSERELFKTYDTVQLKERYSSAKDRIILSFHESFSDTPFLHDTTTISGLPPGYEILVLKSGNNFVLPQDHLYEWSILPENLKHGYRSGVAFKEGELYIIYWVVAW